MAQTVLSILEFLTTVNNKVDILKDSLIKVKHIQILLLSQSKQAHPETTVSQKSITVVEKQIPESEKHIQRSKPTAREVCKKSNTLLRSIGSKATTSQLLLTAKSDYATNPNYQNKQRRMGIQKSNHSGSVSFYTVKGNTLICKKLHGFHPGETLNKSS